ncbi:MAG: 4'-phosphopantetheinyl transferase superfamily protein [Bacteroidales bacterium]|nr:4'-phosphopantetheinyl transferase superfamily protein [Bacteroidales bacterium]
MLNKIYNPISFADIFTGRNRLSLNHGEIHLWNASLDSDKNLKNKCLASLTDQERERIPFFKFEKVRNNFIISQGVLRLLLSDYLNIPPEKIRIERHKKGKPYLADYPSLRFNISNSGKRVVFAFSIDEEIGIDLEYIRKLSDLDELIMKNFTPDERAYIEKTATDKQYRFFKFWTVKEAYLKAIGEGMRLTPDNLEFSVENGKYKLQTISGVFEHEDRIFEDFSPESDYVGTLTFKNPVANISLHTII